MPTINNSQYRLKVAFKGKGTEPLYQYVAFTSRNELVFVTNTDLNSPRYNDYIVTLPKAEWKYVLPEVKRACENRINGIGSWYSSYKLNFEQAFTSNEVVILYFVPSKRFGISTLAELKKHLKIKGIVPVATEQDSSSYGTKFYDLYIRKADKRKVDLWLKSIDNPKNITFNRPKY